jgi:hypothetical protein
MGKTAYFGIATLDHDEELAQAVGNMIVTWSSAEVTMQIILAKITGLDWPMVMTMYYRIPTFEARTKIIRAMLEEWETKKYDPKKIAHALGKLASLSVTRNGWVHGKWALSLDETETVVFNHREKANTPGRRKPVTASAVNNHAAAVRRWRDQLQEFLPD